MKPPEHKSGAHVAADAALCVKPSQTKPDVLGGLSIWLRSRWLRAYVMFSAFGSETDREQMVRLGRFIDALKEVRS